MTSEERRAARKERRKEKRKANRAKTVFAIGTAEDVFSYHDMFRFGLDCCKGVMWKQSTQNFRQHLFSRTAINKGRVLCGYAPKPLKDFVLNERGKTRPIEAPHIDDKQILKTVTKKVLLPLYSPRMIYDNGASIKGKGILFSQKQLDKALRKHLKLYGRAGWIVLIDFKGFFPNADRQVIKEMHSEIADPKLREILDVITGMGSGEKGLPLGVEPSQAEMIALPSPLDNYMSCQMRLKGFGHYMDDYHMLVPPDEDPKELAEVFKRKALELGMYISPGKTKVVPFGKAFKFCKMKRVIYGEKIIKRGCRDSVKRARRKIKKFAKTEMPYEDIYTSVNSIMSYFDRTDNHNTVLGLRRLFYKKFGFSCEDVGNFRRGGRNAIHMPQKI